MIDGQLLEGESFHGLKITQFVAIASTFRSCDFSNARMEEASFGSGVEQSTYVDCCFDGAEIHAAAPGNARFERCTFGDVKIHVFNGVNVEFVDCVFTGTIKKGFFNGTPFGDHPISRKKNDFRGNDFSDAVLLDVGFRKGIDLSLQRLPTGADYIYVEDGERFVRSLPSKELTEKYGNQFSAIERVLQMNVSGGQRQIFLSIKGHPARSRPVLVELKRIAEGTLLA